jgi:hypothetical protein
LVLGARSIHLALIDTAEWLCRIESSLLPCPAMALIAIGGLLLIRLTILRVDEQVIVPRWLR